MTTIITRLYADQAAAQAVADVLAKRGHEDVHVFTDGTDAARAAGVPGDAAAAYARHMAKGNALLVVRAGFNPVGAARDAIRTLAAHPGIDAGLRSEEHYIREDAVLTGGYVLDDHPHMFLRKDSLGEGRHFSRAFGLPMLRHRGTIMTSTSRSHGHMIPMKLLSQKSGTSAMGGGRLMAGIFPHLTGSGWQMSKMFSLPSVIDR
jgi:hypothetical protein